MTRPFRAVVEEEEIGDSHRAHIKASGQCQKKDGVGDP